MTGAVRLTLPGATVTRDVTWDAVRAYLRAEGWQDRGIDSDLWETWTRGVAALRFGDGEAAMSRIVSELADPANVSPGEMLARIAAADDPAWTMVYGVRGRPCVWEHSDGRLEVRS